MANPPSDDDRDELPDFPLLSPQPDALLGDYRLLREVGRGGMGVVYEAEQISLGRRVAVKVLTQRLLRDAQQQQRFEREARAAAKLHHTNIVPVFGFGEHNGVPYYAMQLIRGRGLDVVLQELANRVAGQACATRSVPAAQVPTPTSPPQPAIGGEATTVFPQDKGPFPCHALAVGPQGLPGVAEVVAVGFAAPYGQRDYWRGVARLGMQVADALDHAHRQGVLHRDVKPSNLLLDEGGTAWVTDFGLAKANDSENLTRTGDVLGTLRYLAPEAFDGRADARSDVYGLGLTLYEFLALRPAFPEKDQHRLIKQVTTTEPPRLDRLDPALPRDLVTIVHKAIEHDPAQRYGTAGLLADDLRRFLNDEAIRARRASLAERGRRWARRHPGVAMLLTTLAVVLLLGFAAVSWKWREAEFHRRQAESAAERLGDALAQAEQNFALAREAVDRYLSEVSDREELKEPNLRLLRKQLLGTAREFYERFLRDHGDDPESRERLAWAYLRLGSITYEADHDPVAALAFAAKGRQLYARLAEEQPNNPAHRRKLAQSASDEGFYLTSLRRHGEAEASFRRAIEQQELLLRETDADEDRRRLADCLRNFTRFCLFDADRPADLELCRREVALRGRLCEGLPAEAIEQIHYGWSLIHLGQSLISAGRSAEAEEPARRAVALFEHLAEKAPRDGPTRAGQGAAYSTLAQSFQGRDVAEARRLAEKAVEENRAALRLATMPVVRRNLALSYWQLAELALTQGHHEEAAQHARNLLASAEFNSSVGVPLLLRCARLARDDLKLPESDRHRLAEDYLDEAGQHLLGVRGRPTRAADQNALAEWLADFPLALYRDPDRAVELARQACEAEPANPRYRRTLGLALYRAGQFREARAALEQALTTPGSQLPRGRTLLLLAMAARQLEDSDAATLHQKALAALGPPGTEEDATRRLRDEAAALLAGRDPLAAEARACAVLHDADSKGLDAWVQRMVKEGFRPVFVHGHGRPGGPRFAAVAFKPGMRGEWAIFRDKGSDAFQKRFEAMVSRAFRVVSLSGYTEENAYGFVSLWVRPGLPDYWCRHAATGAFVRLEAKRLQASGLRLTSLSTYPIPKGSNYTTLYHPDQGKDWSVELELSAAQYDKAIAAGRQKNWRPAAVAVCPVGGEPRFSVVLLRDHPDLEWHERHDLTAAAFAQENARQAAAGFHPEQVVGYEHHGESRYLAVWVKERRGGRRPLLTRGDLPPALAPFDAAMRKFMAERTIPAGALAVMKDGTLLLARGYGHADREGKRPVEPDTPFRLASLTKPITAAAIRRLAGEGKLSLDDKVLPLLGLGPPAGRKLDPRWQEITLRHLLRHQGGFDRGRAGDPMFQSRAIQDALKLPGPPGPADLVRYLAGQPLQFDPGTKTAYSNFGYCLLGRAVEKASGRPYVDYVREKILAPLGAGGIKLGRTLPPDRDPREPFYSDPRRGQDVMHGPGELVPSPDGSFHLEAMDAHGGLIGPAADVAKFFHAYGTDGTPALGKPRAEAAFGSLPGTFTMATKRPDGVVIVALFNQRVDLSGLDYFVIRPLLEKAADTVREWPEP